MTVNLTNAAALKPGTPRSSLPDARRHAERAMDARHRLWNLASRSLSDLFGVALSAAICTPLEEVTEHYGEAVYHYEATLTENEQRHANEVAFVRYETSVVRGELLHARNVLREAVADTKSRFGKNGRVLPGWVAVAEQAAPVEVEVEPF